MNAHALLTSQGWRGTGHSLHATSDDRGLRRPILVSQKQNQLGIGKKQHRTSDMWWQNAFDKSLKGLDTSKEGAVKQTLTSGGLDMVAKGGGKYVGTGGLYSCFVKGANLDGTMTPEDGSEIETKKTRGTKAERKARKVLRAQNRLKRAERRAVKEVTRSEKKVLREERRAKKESSRATKAARSKQTEG